MRGKKNQAAIDAFQRVIGEEGYDGKTIRAQAMYWSGMCYQGLRQPLAAYAIFKRLTYDFRSEWKSFSTSSSTPLRGGPMKHSGEPRCRCGHEASE